MEGFFASKRQLEPSSADRFDSSRRRHSSASAATSFKHPSAPVLKLSPTETLFRILCPADKTGGVIGKGGSIIRQFREETGAKIRIDDPVPGSDDRVILIIAEAQQVKTKREEDTDVEGDNISPAQRALVRVFERILRVEEEWSGEAEAGAGEGKEIQGPVVCRLLAPSSHVGCVLGKGGKIVEKIRLDSGAHIRVLSKEQVPLSAAAGDELIHITGSFSAVRKALLSVSSRLQDNTRMDAANFANTKLFGAPGSGSLVQVDRFPQRGFVAGLHAPESQSRVYSSNDITASGYKKVIEEEVLFRMLCSNEKVGSIIGKGGVIVRALQSETGALIKVVDAVPDSEERVVVISARENSDLEHSPTQEAVLRVHSRLMEAGVEKGSAACARLLVPLQQIGCFLGKGGNIISEMRRVTGASIRIFLKEHVPKCAQPNDEVVQVTGSFQSVQDALLHITGRIRETILPVKPHLNIGTTQYMSTQHDISPALFRSRNEPPSPGCYSSSGISRGFGRSSGLSPATDRQTPLSQSVDCRGLATADRISYSYGNETSGLCSAFDCSSPRSWAPQTVNSGSHRSITDSGTGLGFRGVMGGSGSLTAVATSTTVEVVVPHHFLGFVFGENSSNLSQIRDVSGAEVTIHDLKPGATEGAVIISGTSDQTRAAQSLLHAFILCGKMKT